ncbi:MAG: hypothetical protein M3316_07290 [Actinomycetota bacterium]|nr:hypothetical protein [Actinomycetota bacterium]
MDDRGSYFERMLAENPTGLLALANEYRKAERYEGGAAVLELPTRINAHHSVLCL